MDLVQEKTYTNNYEISEKIFEEFYSKVDILYFLIDAEGFILSSNVSSQEILEYEKDELVGKKFPSLCIETCRKEAEEMFTACYQRGYIKDYYTTLQDHYGRKIHVVINGLTEGENDGYIKKVRYFIRNINELTQIKQQKDLSLQLLKMYNANESNEHLIRKVLNGIQQVMDGSWIGVSFIGKDGIAQKMGTWSDSDPSSGDTADHFRNWDPGMWDRLLKDCVQSDVAHFTHLKSFWTTEFSDLLFSLFPIEEENPYESLDDYQSVAVIPFHTSWDGSGYFIVVNENKINWCDRDIEFIEEILPLLSYRKPEERVDKSSSLETQNFSMLNVPILGIILVKNGKVQKANKWIESLLGYSAEELVSKNFIDLFTNDTQEAVLGISQKSFPEKDSNNNMCEAQVLTKSGEKRSIMCASSTIASNGDSAAIWYWINKEDRHKLQEQLMHARRMESLGMLAGGIVHDFNNLLACILGYSSLLSEEISKDSPYYEDVQQITRTSEKATELTARLMAYAQGGSYIVDALDVNQLIKEVAAILSRTLDKNISIRAELDSKLDSIKGDASQIQQAILQVALNARDAMLNGGKLSFQTKNIFLGEDNAWLRFRGEKGRYVQIIVSDTGSGMTGQVKERIFEPYFSTKNKGVGQGLGLSIVQEIIEKHGGFISVFSEKDKGTVFKIHLPASISEKNVELKRAPVSTEKPILGKETILLVDDEKVLRETARKMLTRYGYKVISAESGREALAVFKKFVDRIDLIILDTILPGMDLDKIFVLLRKVNPKIKIIASAGPGERTNMQREIEQNIAAIVQKPFQVRPLLKKVRSVLNA